MRLVVYGAFNCPYSFVASRRADRLAELGVAEVNWRAVVHDPGVPAVGVAVTGDLAEMFDREFDEIRALLRPDEPYMLSRPTVQPNTTLAVAGYSTVAAADVDPLRRALFDALWVEGLDIGDAEVLGRLGCPPAAPTATMGRWREERLGFERPTVPMMVLPDGARSRGLGALKRLADLMPGGSAAR